jgi:ribonuclease HI
MSPRAQRRPGGTMRDGERRRLGKRMRAQRAASSTPANPAGMAVAWCDGGSRGNPGPAAYGYVIEDADGAELAREAGLIGVATAASAEYRAVLEALGRALALGLAVVEVRSDSRLLIAHLNGTMRPRNPSLAEHGEVIRKLAGRVGLVRYSWVPRSENQLADGLLAAQLGMEGYEGIA